MESLDLGSALRRWRDQVTPQSVGLPVGQRRRAAGLRREELALLAGISPDYLTRLEQGRATAPSTQVVASLARALRLSDGDRTLLYELAGVAVPGAEVVPSHVPPSVQRMLDRLAHTPVVVYDATWTLVTANAHYDALMGDTTGWRGLERNAVWRHLNGLPSRVVHTPEEHARHVALLVADLRLTTARYPTDRRLRRLVHELGESAPGFVALWEAPTPAPPADRSRRKVVDHPDVGRITLDCDTLLVSLDDLRISVYTAEPGTEDADRLALALVLGTQSLVT
ncbi:helix-turn-helix transcriptional regulator [Luteipulveratus sp. YIM 133132]|uniref:Helix-turn-helix transcriptional regulator n=1 Tax=Luteipulveratus flavus TaxID=3031728 RepID=A0ABT6C1P8_9MICO|nr:MULTISPECIES: helix-turn-helix transcriptional regulator [unclassified Luteipulveratus]MDE9364773.1 helix-turn-helix transcriptional regulator [Luteipulveratus sp. YIM 133132]MDF8262670.1 helix-turn-helix transcriptional regulator [Luteipulveratus sp. YIM 133296]